ncbi:MAG: MBL fold metallo-hydrolase [Promethearchaeia archaeon]
MQKKIDIILLSNNKVEPFQQFRKKEDLSFLDLNKLFATQSLAEHGLGFLINIYNVEDPNDEWSWDLDTQIVFDTGGSNLTYLHNLDVRAYNFYNVAAIVLSHWHYDHTGGLYKILERINTETKVISHSYDQYERFFIRSDEVSLKDLAGKTRQEILPLLSTSKIVNQEPIDQEKLEELEGKLIHTKEVYPIIKNNFVTISASGKIPRTHEVEDFQSYYLLKGDKLVEDEIPDDRCLIFEFPDNTVVLNGCCHSGLMNTLDYVDSISDEPITHIIGGFHMTSASEKRINETITYLKDFQEYNGNLYLFPIHCTGHTFLDQLKKEDLPNIKAFDVSVGTKFTFQ